MYKRKNKYYKLMDCDEIRKLFLMKEYKKILWLYIPRKRTQAFWVDKYEFKKYTRMDV